MTCSNLSLLMVGNFFAGEGHGSRQVCQELAAGFSNLGLNVITSSEKAGRLPRLVDMLLAVWSRRNAYEVAIVDVFSGFGFVWAFSVCILLRFLGKPHILALHGGNLPGFSKRFPWAARYLFSGAKLAVAPSQYLIDKLSYIGSNFYLIPNPIKIKKIHTKLRTTIKPRLVWLRAFHAIYNPAMAIETLAILRESGVDATLAMIGPDSGDGSRQYARRIASELRISDYIEWVGPIPKSDVPEWLNRYDIFLNTSDVDNAPVSVVEAQACGLCVVSTDVGGMGYLVNNGKDGFLVHLRDAHEMARAIRALLSDPKLAFELSKNGVLAASLHDHNEVIKKWATLLRNTING